MIVGDGGFAAAGVDLDGLFQIAHEEGICEAIESRLKELLSLPRISEPAVHQQRGDSARNVESMGKLLEGV